jgi:hypothetical protein
MKNDRTQYQAWKIFLAVVALIAFTQLAEAFRLWDLYFDAPKRALIVETMRRTADQEGWLASDIALTETRDRQVRFVHLPHHKGYDAPQCFTLRLSKTSKPVPCPGLLP